MMIQKQMYLLILYADTDVCQIYRVVSGVFLNSEVILLEDKINDKHKMTRRQFPV